MAERKKYIEAEIPLLGSTIRILGTPEDLHNKTVKLDLTRQLRGKGLTIKFRIFNEEGKLTGIPNKMELANSYIRRMMRKRSDYVEDSFQGQCADIRATIKPLLITRKRVSRAVRKNLRNTAKEFILGYIKEKEFNDICQEILEGTLQKTMLPKLKKIYPLSFCEIRIFETKELEKANIKKISEKETGEDVEEVEDIQEVAEENVKKEIEETTVETKVEKKEVSENKE